MFIRSLFFFTIVFIFSMLWQATDAHQKLFHTQAMIWYLVITETIVLSLPIIQFEIENDIRTGDIVYQLTKPIHYLWGKIFENLGAFCFRFLVLLFLGLCLCPYLSEGYIPPFFALISAYFTAFLAGIVLTIFHACIGITACRLQDCSPLFWIWQRSTFLFGGLLLPLDFYPWYLKWIADLLPFSALLYKPAHLMLDASSSACLTVLGGIFLWGGIAIFCSKFLYDYAIRCIKINGG